MRTLKNYKKRLGALGEDTAAAYLKGKGYRIVKRNFTIRGGEIDIIAQYGGYVIFVEVKTRTTDEMGSGLEAVTAAKQQFLRRAAQFYLGPQEQNVRFDVIEVQGELVQNQLRVQHIEHVENAF